MKPLIGGMCALATLALSAINAFAITIDEFEGNMSLQSQVGVPVSFASVNSSGAIGGARSTELSVLSPSNGHMSVISVGGIYGHSQDFGVFGYSLLSWDGDSNAETLTSTGLGGVDFTQDGGSAMQIELISFDLPGGQPLPLRVRVYDASDSNRISEGTATLTSAISSLTTVTIPFNTFIPVPGSTGVDFRSVGAISLKIDGAATAAADVGLEWFGTNGQCRLVPDSNGRVIDICGVCGGNGTSCLDCNGVPFGGAQYDVCGVCGGDGSSCADCNGEPFGKAVLDRCGICNGDGQSCVTCFDTNLSTVSATLDGGAKKLEARIKVAAKRLGMLKRDVGTKIYITKTLELVHRLQIRNWNLSWVFPRTITTCNNEQVCTFTSYQSTADEYRVHNEELLRLGKQVVSKLRAINKVEAKRAKNYLNKIQAQYEANLNESYVVPVKDFSC